MRDVSAGPSAAPVKQSERLEQAALELRWEGGLLFAVSGRRACLYVRPAPVCLYLLQTGTARTAVKVQRLRVA